MDRYLADRGMSIPRMLRERGWTVIGVDSRAELEPDVIADVRTYEYSGPAVDLVWASPPCVEFAKTDKRCWYPDAPTPSMELVDAALRIIAQVQPRAWLLENVRGARPWFRAHVGPSGLRLGAPVLQSPPLYLWGSPPPPAYCCLLRGMATRNIRAGAATTPEPDA